MAHSTTEEEAQLRELFASTSDLVYTHDLAGRFLSVNGAVSRLLGYAPDEFLKLDLAQVIAPEHLAAARQTMAKKLSRTLRKDLAVAVAKDGRRVPLELRTRLVYDGEGRPTAVFGIAREAGTGRAAAARLAESESRFRGLVEQSLAGIYIVQERGFAYVNPRFAEIFGYRPDELIGRLGIEDLVSEADRQQVRDSVRKRFAGELDDLRFTFTGRRKDGGNVDVEVHGARTQWAQGPAIIGTLLDVTERRRAEAAVRESEERYALAALGANDGLWDWDLRTGQVYFSARWKAMLGIAPEVALRDAADWIGRVHLDDRERVQADIATHLEGRTPHLELEHRIRHDDGSFRWVLVRGLAVRGPDGRSYRMAGSLTDITERKVAEEKLLHDALHDALTGLPNRTLFMDRLSQAMAFARRRDGYRYAVLFLDIDRFKTVNESLGHFKGDQLLVDVGRRLTRCVREGDTVARLGGDEFVVLLEDFQDPQEPLHMAERIHDELAPAHDLDGTEVFATASIGVAHGNAQYTRPLEILRDADTAMYRAKDLGRAHHVVFQPSMHARARALLQLESDLRRALDRGELRLTYQPVVSLRTGAVAGCEALCVWQHPTRGRVTPTEFIPVAEETGLIVPLGAWVLQEACRAAREWTRALPPKSPFSMAVNISARQLLQPALLDHVRSALESSGLDGDYLRLEITESVIMENAGPATLLLSQLRNLHVHLLLDDFGTGYSSLGYLHNFRFDTLKIDRSFVSKFDSGGRQAEIVRTIVALARTLGMEVVAEGVETAQQASQLQQLQCDYAQGFLFSRPIEPDAFGELLATHRQFPLPTPLPPLGSIAKG
jgi:diguanylate cyclase (GGDEF)-like protein/PAS domain S-box-containing protein